MSSKTSGRDNFAPRQKNADGGEQNGTEHHAGGAVAPPPPPPPPSDGASRCGQPRVASASPKEIAQSEPS
jgi:hypothetical protein